MRDINLIPPDAVEARQKKVRIRFWVAVNLTALGVLAAAFGMVAWKARVESRTVSELDQRASELKNLNEELESLRAVRALLRREEQALGSLLDRTSACLLVTRIAETITENGWLSQMTLNHARSETQREGLLTLEGHAASYTHLARLMRDLGLLDSVEGVDLRRSSRAEAEGLNVVRFEIDCRLARGL